MSYISAYCVEIDGEEVELNIEYDYTPGESDIVGADPLDSSEGCPAEVEILTIEYDEIHVSDTAGGRCLHKVIDTHDCMWMLNNVPNFKTRLEAHLLENHEE